MTPFITHSGPSTPTYRSCGADLTTPSVISGPVDHHPSIHVAPSSYYDLPSPSRVHNLHGGHKMTRLFKEIVGKAVHMVHRDRYHTCYSVAPRVMQRSSDLDMKDLAQLVETLGPTIPDQRAFLTPREPMGSSLVGRCIEESSKILQKDTLNLEERVWALVLLSSLMRRMPKGYHQKLLNTQSGGPQSRGLTETTMIKGTLRVLFCFSAWAWNHSSSY